MSLVTDIETEAGDLLTGVEKLFGGAPEIATDAVTAANASITAAQAALAQAEADGATASDQVLDTIADKLVNEGMSAVPGLSALAPALETGADADVNAVIRSLTDKVSSKLQAAIMTKLTPPAAPEAA
jgi:hypothetical protein